jgi:hypothetical protein
MARSEGKFRMVDCSEGAEDLGHGSRQADFLPKAGNVRRLKTFSS